jgi:stage III sporulation protein AH
MKNIFRKNQVIITALVLMIAIAGYLNFTNDKVANQNGDNDTYVDSDSNATASDNASVDTDSLLSSADLASSDLLAEATDDSQDVAAESDEIADADEASSDEADATTDISDEDMAEVDDSIPVSDNGELVTDDTEDKSDTSDSTGEAVLVNSTLSSSYFSSTKLKREQSRAQQRETLMNIIGNNKIADDQKEVAMDSIIKMNEITEKENVTESLIEAKGFENVVVSILENSVDVVVEVSNITDQQVAQIENIVKSKTGISVENITITPVQVD